MFAPRRLPRAPVFGELRRARPCWRRARPPASRGRRAAGVRSRARSSPRTRPRARSARSRSARCERIGARSGSPVQYMFPDAAITPRSDARQPERGPSLPNGEMRTHTACGARAGSSWCVPRRAELVEHDVGVGEQRVERGVVGRERDHLLAGVPRAGDVAGRARSPPGGTTRTTSAPRSPSTRAGAGRRVAAEIEHPQPVEQPLRHAETLPREPDGGVSVRGAREAILERPAVQHAHARPRRPQRQRGVERDRERCRRFARRRAGSRVSCRTRVRPAGSRQS